MKTIKIKLYKYDELSEDAKQRAIQDYRTDMAHDNFWQNENNETLKAFEEIFPVRIKEYSYHHYINYQFTEDDEIRELSGQRLATYIWNNYRNDIYKPKQYWICNGHKNCVGKVAKHRNSNVFIYDELGCNLTGFYIDNEILAPIFEFMRKPDSRDFEQLLYECLQEWLNACEKDYEGLQEWLNAREKD